MTFLFQSDRAGRAPHRRAVKILVFGSVIILGVAVLFVGLHRSPEFTYRDHSISYWFTQLPLTWVSSDGGASYFQVRRDLGQDYGNPSNASAPILALDAFGTNAVPYLIAKLTGRDRVIEREATRLFLKAGVRWVPFRNADLERYQAVTGLVRIEELPPTALQLLTVLRTNMNPELASAADFVLQTRKREATPMVGEEQPLMDVFSWWIIDSIVSNRRTWID